MVDISAPPSLPTTLANIGLEIETDNEPGGGENYVVRGDTYRHKETLKAHGGRWSKSRRAWVFHDRSAIERLSTVLSNGAGNTAPPGFAEAPLPFRQPGEVQSTRSAPDKHFHGHRKRLRTRFMSVDDQSMPDYELLELLLFFSIQYVDVKLLAKRLLHVFGSLGGVLAADPKRLEEVMCSINGREGAQIEKDRYFTVLHLKAMRRLLERVLIEDVKERPMLSSWQALLDYLKVALGHEPIEQFRLLFLDSKNILIEDKSALHPGQSDDESHDDGAYSKRYEILDQVQQRGTVNHTPLYPREIAKRALELEASAVIMVHNHPSGDPTPSRADIEMTKQVEAALAPIRVALHDHLIIGKDRHLSFKSEGLI